MFQCSEGDINSCSQWKTALLMMMYRQPQGVRKTAHNSGGHGAMQLQFLMNCRHLL